jgi:hypothetical protein
MILSKQRLNHYGKLCKMGFELKALIMENHWALLHSDGTRHYYFQCG